MTVKKPRSSPLRSGCSNAAKRCGSCLMPKTNCLPDITGSSSAAHQMLDIIAKKLDDAEVHIFRLGRQSAVQSVAAFLLEMESRLGQRRGSLELPMTRR